MILLKSRQSSHAVARVRALGPVHEGLTLAPMDFLVTDDGRYLALTDAQSLLLDASAILEDLSVAFDDLEDAIAVSRSLVADSRRWRRMRQSGLRAVVLED